MKHNDCAMERRWTDRLFAFEGRLAKGRLAALALSLAAAACAAPAEEIAYAEASGWRAQITALREATVSSIQSALVTAVPHRDGERFEKGEALIGYDCALPKARLARAKAAENGASGKLSAAAALRKLNSISRTDYAEAQAAFLTAKAEREAEAIQVERCSLRAPYPGVVGEVFIHPGEYAPEGAKLLTIYDDSAFEAVAILPSALLKTLRTGTPLLLRIDETGSTHIVRVARIAGRVDPVSQSVKVTCRLEKKESDGDPTQLRPGMSGTVYLDPLDPTLTEALPASPEAASEKGKAP